MNNNTEALGRAPIGRLFLKLALPAVTAQIINLLYNLVDRMYIGRMEPVETVGRLALTGAGVCLPIIMVVSAFAALFGMGAAPRASIALGRGDKDLAEKYLGNSVTALVTMSVILTLVFSFWSEPILMAFGADSDTIGYAMSYLQIYAVGTTFVLVTLGLNPFISGQGFSKEGMLTVLIGAVINIILDPIFIFVFHMGIAGAALATILSQFVSMLWILHFLTGKKTTIAIRKCHLRPDRKVILSAMALGMAPFIMQSTESLLSMAFNTSLRAYGGTLAVGAMTVLASAMQLVTLPLMGLAMGSQPIVSYNYGAQNFDRVRKGFKILFIASVSYTTFMWAFLELFPQVFVLMFNSDQDLVDFTSNALRIYAAGVLFMGAQLACQQTFVALGQAKISMFLALLRKIVLLIPLIYILPNFFANKTNAVFMAEPVSDILAASTTMVLFALQFKKMMPKTIK